METSSFAMESSRISPSIKMASRWEPSKWSYKVSRTTSTYARSYTQWNTTNTLYWNPRTREWLTSEKYFQQVRARIPGLAVWPVLMAGSLGIFVLILFVLLFSLAQYNRKLKVINQRSERTLQISERNGQIAERNAQILEQGLKLQEANAKVFQEMLAELKKMSAGS